MRDDPPLTLARHGARMALLLALAALLLLPMLGRSGFAATEGHRVAPAWAMLDSGEWSRLEMFGAPYLRKPPGMPWAIAASSEVFGRTERAARLVSALSAALLAAAAYVFAARWFGGRWGLFAGLAQLLMPWTWPSARSAEIESLHTLGAGLAAYLLIEILAARPARAANGRAIGSWGSPVLLAGAALLALLAKGPASAPMIVGVVAGAGWARRSWWPAVDPRWWLPFLSAAAAFGMIMSWVWRVSVRAGEPITQDVSEFLWAWDRAPALVVMAPAALAAMLPASLSLLFPWGADARRERADDDPVAATVASAAARGILLSLAAYVALGVSNPRYAMPVAPLASVLAAWAARGVWASVECRGRFGERRRSIGRVLGLGLPRAWPVALTIAGAGYVWLGEARRGEIDGRAAGRAIASAILDARGEGHAEVWADEVIEARPDVLLYARSGLGAASGRVRFRWEKSALRAGSGPGEGEFVLLRTDAGDGEAERFATAVESGSLRELARGRVGRYGWALCRVEHAPGVGLRPR
ncbi:MAG: glycosyltransferase family 39 protein [Phycisphaerae bacterium]|nr:glycosyltransferase family 39 protein [Phycisphaerae bacterium]